jgi:hypothetical protein
MLLGDLTSTDQEDATEPNNEICASRGDPLHESPDPSRHLAPSGRQETGASHRPSPPEPLQTYPLRHLFCCRRLGRPHFRTRLGFHPCPSSFGRPRCGHPYLIPTPAAGECHGRSGPAPYRRGWGKTEFDSTPESNLSCSKLRRSIMRSVTNVPVAGLCSSKSGPRFSTLGACAVGRLTVWSPAQHWKTRFDAGLAPSRGGATNVAAE